MPFRYPTNKLAPKTGSLLLAQPMLPDSVFSRAAILLCSYAESESFGLIINKPTGFRFETDPSGKNFNSTTVKVYNGGPVDDESMFILHNQRLLSENATEVLPGLFFGGDYPAIFDALNDEELNPSNFRCILGYSIWGPGQLDREIEEGSWFVKETNAREVLHADGRMAWKDLICDMGAEYAPLSQFPERDYYN